MNNLPFTITLLFLQALFFSGQLTAKCSSHQLEQNVDPYLNHSWLFLETNPYAIDILGLHHCYATGKQVAVAVIDSYFDHQHEDLNKNIDQKRSRNFLTPQSALPELIKNLEKNDFHGTSISGLIGAQANALGGRGLAPNAQIVTYNYLKLSNLDTFSQSHVEDPRIKREPGQWPIRVYNQSYGLNSAQPMLYEDEKWQVLRQGVAGEQRAIYVKSSGNGFKALELPAMSIRPNPDQIKFHNLPVQSSQGIPENNFGWNWVVGAHNQFGEKASYSSTGANLLITAPGAEQETGFLTTDLSGCDAGLALIFSKYVLGAHCQYNRGFFGTSAATSLFAATIALMLDINPLLSWRDLRHIFIATANRSVKVPWQGVTSQSIHYELESDWLVNAAGNPYSHYWGVGLLDVEAAVKMAKSYKRYLPRVSHSDWYESGFLEGVFIPDQEIKGVMHQIEVLEDWQIETVEVKLTAQHMRLGDLAIELISPAGTRSVIFTPGNALIARRAVLWDTLLASQHFFEESSRGAWTIRFIDLASQPALLYQLEDRATGQLSQIERRNDSLGWLDTWSIRFIGEKKDKVT